MASKSFALFGLFALILLSFDAPAGGGPETTLVVVNGASPLSKRIANEYVHLRNIPPGHVVWLEDIPSVKTIPIETFREKIWRPIRDFMRTHGLEQEIDVIAYSADFPYAVDFKTDLWSNKIKRNEHLGTKASLTSLTYFARRVDVGDAGYLGKNHYFADFAGPRIKKDLISVPVSATQLDPKEYKRLWKAGRKALGRGDYSASLKIYRKILDSNPRKPRAWYDLSRTLAAAGKREEALAALGEAVDRGWAHSLLTQREKHFKRLYGNPRFQRLVSRMESVYGPFQLPHGFRNHYVWSNSDLNYWEPRDDLDRYYLSTMLAYTGERGNSLPEVLDYLAAAAASDGTRPTGTVYLLENSNIRSETRQPFFHATAAELAKRGRTAEILSKGRDKQNGILPVGKSDVIGAVVGFPDYTWSSSGSRLLPGAIAETLTSYGGDFNKGKQTKLTEFLRHGAAGSSGAVMEPFSFQEKFPVPLLHVYYADGCSLAESFYQSLFVPYQLIIVGDPLTQPFAHIAEVTLESPRATQSWSGTVKVVPAIRSLPPKGIEKVELWVDGQFVADAPKGAPIPWDTRKVADGHHEMRLVAVEAGTIETRSSASFNINVQNGTNSVQINTASPFVVYGDEVVVSGTTVGADSVALYYGNRKLGEAAVREGKWRVVVDSMDLGGGPVSLQARTLSSGIPAQSTPLRINVRDPDRISPAATLRSPLPGLKATLWLQNGEVRSERVGSVDGFLKELNKQEIQPQRVTFEGYFEVERSGFYQLLVAGKGNARVTIDDRAVLVAKKPKEWRESFLGLGLEAGWHKLQLVLETPHRRSNPKIVLAGAEVAKVLSGKNLFQEEPGNPRSGQ